MADEQAAHLETARADGEQQTFEEALERLEYIVSTLEAGELELDKALLLFQEGIDLARFCSGKLDEAEAKIERLVEKADGSLETVSYEAQPEAEL